MKGNFKMKIASIVSLVLALSASGFATAQSGGMDHASMSGMHDAAQKASEHQVMAVVRAVNPAKGSVTLAHEAIPSLNWPAMTMGFTVKDSKLFNKLAVGSKVKATLTKQGADYIVTAVQ
jgi:Cu(I)/Ag(I) efflux system protein CusF